MGTRTRELVGDGTGVDGGKLEDAKMMLLMKKFKK
jgi:hypothetical protein